MVHGGHHGGDGGAVGESQDADLRASQKLLDHHPAAGVPEGPVLHHGPDGILCLFIGPGDQHALAQGQTVRLDDDGEGGGFQIGERRSGRIEHLISGGGDVIFFHQVLGKDLAGLDPGGSGVRPEAGDARGVEGVHTPQSQRIVRRHHREPHGVGDGEVHNSADVCGADLRHTNGVSGDAAVARQGVNRLHHRIFFQFFDDGVLPAAAAYYEKIHRIVLLASCIKQCEERPGKTGQAFPVDLPSQIRKGNFIAPIRAQTRQTRRQDAGQARFSSKTLSGGTAASL